MSFLSPDESRKKHLPLNEAPFLGLTQKHGRIFRYGENKFSKGSGVWKRQFDISLSESIQRLVAGFCSMGQGMLKTILPLASRLAPAMVARKAWLEQTFDVAFSFRMCCSRVDRTITKQSRFWESFALPMYRPGVFLKSFFELSL